MSYIDNFKPHAIPSIKKTVCNAEQKIAYNFLFARHDTPKNKALDTIQKSLAAGKETNFKKYDIDLIYHYILQSYDRYMKYNSTGILWNYEEIGSVIYSDILTI